MSNRSDSARLEAILMYIDDIAEIIQNHGDLRQTLADKEGEYAVMMCLVQIGEALARLASAELRGKLPVKLASSLRNVIVHDYEGVDPKVVELTIERSLPDLKTQILELL